MDKQTQRRPSIHLIRRRRRRRRRARLFLLFLLFCLLIGLSTLGYASWRIDHALDGVTGSFEEEGTAGAPFSILILGNDNRPETGTNLMDVMIVAAVDPKQGQIAMVSIPRDTKVRFADLGRRVKANEAYSIGEYLKRQNDQEKTNRVDGPSLAKKMASQLFEIPIDHYVMIDFKGFMAMIDEIGGIEIEVERELIYNDPTDQTHIHLLPGQQHVNGKEALDWVRHRHDDRGLDHYSSDFDRNRRQQEVITAVAVQMKTMTGISNVFDALDIMAAHIQTDLTKTQIRQLLLRAPSFHPDKINRIETPNVYWDGGLLQTVIPEEDLKAASEQLNELLNGDMR
ncbi:hypothetical protein BEP19_16080 [Ammoniphilus oxalaticus]|uniref:Cell envelope-related transcriptional attenuator domain-containing protein n=1 Tax=Ammoniphilus oxalaticus TaxID=66863 RepID=A0A419SQF3_9BACL|nr:LCP family protein [Ammoniphilus oxalaticus]RKD26720.1 hypothetical protein BEP19_16080 [Ammoniphilus oxalaticus]